jgi:predicted dinucleotide-binding enzyme
MATTAGILGTGMVGRVMAAKLSALGFQVKVGTRDVANTLGATERNQYGGPPFAEWRQQHKAVSVGTFREAAQFGAIIFNCTNGGASLEAITLAGPEHFRAKTVLDISNPLDFTKGSPPVLLPQFTNTNSLAEEIQTLLPDANVVKTLNMVNCEVMVDPAKTGGAPTMFVAGNNAGAKDETKSILRQFGWTDIIDLGDITGARGMEMMLPVWLRTWQATQNGYFGLKIVRG